jgi:diguanylate cyclase (GGDEF)-like protein
MIYIAGFIIFLFISDLALANFGLVFLYTLPQIAWIFFGIRCALWLMALNAIPFLLLVSGHRPALPVGIDMLVPSTPSALHALLFLFFNICLPLAFFRVFAALKTGAVRNTKANSQLESSNALYQDMFEYAGDPALICDPQGYILKANGLALSLFNRPLPSTLKLSDLLLSGAQDKPEALIERAKQTGFAEGDFIARAAHDEPLEIHLAIKLLGRRQCLLATIKNLSPIRRMQRELAAARDARDRLISYDQLTDLPNRAYLRGKLQELAAQHAASGDNSLLAVASIRLKSARSVNEKFGQMIGDQLIREFSALLIAQANSAVIPCRLHGVVFGLLITGTRSPAELEQLIEALMLALNQPLDVSGRSIGTDTAVGVAFMRGADISADELIRRSEHALEAARKSTQDSFMLFNEDFARETHRKIEIEMALAHAIEKGEFALEYQPKVLADGTITGLEALLRWQSPELGAVSPVEFIPIAERAGKIHAITRYVIDATCRQQRRWLDRHGRAWPVAINLSGIDLQREDISVVIVDTAAEHRIEPQLLQIEITETGLIENDEVARQNLEYLLHLGFQIAIDDFGTGYSSLKKLSEYPINTIKIDRSFVLGIDENTRSEQIIGLILTLAKFLQCEAVAEGVETERQLEFLQKNGCSHFQGYLFYRPLSAAGVDALLAAQFIEK